MDPWFYLLNAAAHVRYGFGKRPLLAG